MSGGRTAWRLARAALDEGRARRSERRLGLVLTYHRVAHASDDPGLTLNPALEARAFEREVDHLLRRYDVVAPGDVRAAADARRPGEPFPVGLAFDDDTRSHVDVVAPVLRARGVRAAFFLGGWALGGEPRPWWETLQLAVDQGRLDAARVPAPPGLVAAALRRERGAIRLLGHEIELLAPERRRELTADLDAWTEGLARDEGLDAAAIQALAAEHEVGFHTRAHDRLTALSGRALSHALTDGRDDVARAAGRPVTALAYPHGQADERVARAAAEAGYSTGFAGSNRALSPGDDPLLLPRLAPSHASLGIFAVTLAQAFARAA
jgi:peptidoglycan/xylan/chitin deacetylase (PgdA/CDA1 family)